MINFKNSIVTMLLITPIVAPAFSQEVETQKARILRQIVDCTQKAHNGFSSDFEKEMKKCKELSQLYQQLISQDTSSCNDSSGRIILLEERVRLLEESEKLNERESRLIKNAIKELRQRL